jgi:hypothetical protein
MFHDEMDNCPSLATSKTFADILGRRHIEGRRVIGMKGAQSNKIYASPPQRNKFGYHIHDVCSIQNPVYG